MITHWYPSLIHQQKSISSIVQAGPYVIKPEATQANWELHIKYSFFFKWGGAQDNNKQITDPENKPTWPTPNPVQQSVKSAIRKSRSQRACYTPGISGETSLQKVLSNECNANLPTTTTLSTDTEEQVPPKKIKKTQKCHKSKKNKHSTPTNVTNKKTHCYT